MTGELLHAIASIGLDSSAEFAAQPLEPAEFDHFLTQIQRHRLTGLAASAAAEDRLSLTVEQLGALSEADLRAQRQTVMVERELLQVTWLLEAEGIPFRVLKGPAFAHRHWSLPEFRPFVDFDLLVAGDDMAAAIALCEPLGAIRTAPELRRGFDRRFAKGVTLRAESGIEWDLHRTLSLGPYGFLIDLDDLWRDPDQLDLVGRQLPTPTPEVEFVHACLHVTTAGAARLLSLRDVIQIGGVARLDEVERLAKRWRATAVVQEAVTAAHECLQLGVTPLDRWAAALRPMAEEHDLLASYRAVGFSSSVLARLATRHVPGMRQKAAYTAALVMPDRRNRRARQRSAIGHLRAVARNLR